MNAPHQDIVTRPPISAGSASESSVQRTNWREIARIAGSLIRSGAYFSCGVCSSSNIQPMCAHHRPFISAGTVSPYRHGECGSPSASENLWCLRWSATQRTSGPSTAIDPATASAIRSGRFALKEPCVK